jgi:type IV pilus assembly protein PilC
MLGPVLVLVVGFGFAGAVGLTYFVARDNDQLKQKFEAVGIRIPGLTGCYRSFALQRFSLALSMTHEAGMRADESVALSFRATSNGAYVPHAEPAARAVRGGKSITKAMTAVGGGLFPEEFIDSLQVGEESGQLSEVMNRVAEQYREEALRQTKVLARIAGGAVYAMVGLMIIVVIIRILMSIAGVYQDAMKGL